MSDPAAGSPRCARTGRAERAALVAAGRRLFGGNGFRATSVEDMASEARLTTGALYHHFHHQDSAVRAVFMKAHPDLMTASKKAAQGASDGVGRAGSWFDAVLDGVLQRICKHPDRRRARRAGPGPLHGTHEQYAHAGIVHALTAAAERARSRVEELRPPPDCCSGR